MFPTHSIDDLIKNTYLIALWGSGIQFSSSKPVAVTKHANINLATGLRSPTLYGWTIRKRILPGNLVCVRTQNLLNVRADLFPALLTSPVLWLSIGPIKTCRTYISSTVCFGINIAFHILRPQLRISSKLPPKLRMYFYLYRKYTISKKKLTESQQMCWGISKYKLRIFNVSWSVRASSNIPISRPTDATCDRIIFSIYMCITLYVSSVKRSSSGVRHPVLTRQCRRQTQTQKLEAVCTVRDSWWWALDGRNSFLQDSAAVGHKHRN
jgi:hypothetical protein